MTDTTGAVVGRSPMARLTIIINHTRDATYLRDVVTQRGVWLSGVLNTEDKAALEHMINGAVAAAREQCSRDHAREREIWQRAMTRTEAALVKARADADRFESMVAEAYQIVGAMAQEFDCFEHPDVQRALDKFAFFDGAQEDDLLPWPREPLSPACLLTRYRLDYLLRSIRPACGADNPAAAQAANGVSPATGGVSEAETGTPSFFFWLGREAE